MKNDESQTAGAPDPRSHSHEFAKVDPSHESRTLTVVWLTAVTMVVEVAAGVYSGSMALLADGWHMGTHVLALAIAVFAYRFARRHAVNARFTFGTGKVGVLGGFASATTLGIVALLMVAESVHRLFESTAIRFDQAILVAIIGLGVNVASAFILESGQAHRHGPDDPHHHKHDPNLRAAYLHVLADALTSVLAIFALLAGKFFGMVWMDPVMGIIGALLIGRWSFGLLHDTGAILLDAAIDKKGVAAIRNALGPECRLSDLHVWKVGPDSDAAIVSILTDDPKPAAFYKEKLAAIPGLQHITVEVNPARPSKTNP
jgi:cation diffusion facilitator family transporter